MLKIAWAPYYHLPLPEGHKFPMDKYLLLPEQLEYEGTITAANLFEPQPMSFRWIEQTHEQAYIHRFATQQLSDKDVRKLGFPQSMALYNREVSIMHGTCQCVDFALQFGIAINVAGGTHHAYKDRPEGFCLFNDIAVAANYYLDKHPTHKVLVVDLDVHQGNGTAVIFQDNPAVFTWSVHGAGNYPLRKEHSDLDHALPDKTTDEIYLPLVRETLERLIDKEQPNFIFYQSGVDVLETDLLGRLSMTLEGCKARDRIVLSSAHRHRIPLVATMGGGYSKRISDIVEAHANTYRLAQEIYF